MRIYTILIQLIAGLSFIDAISKNNEQIRSYEFGFNIEGFQHRHESKDGKGIIMGEFGFITADGVYHVTAYATDENGRFKILFMKNIKIGLPDNQAAFALQLPRSAPPQVGPISSAPVNMEKIGELSLQNFGLDSRSCSGCAIPNAAKENQANLSKQTPKSSNIYPVDEKNSKRVSKLVSNVATRSKILRPVLKTSSNQVHKLSSSRSANVSLQIKAETDFKKLKHENIELSTKSSYGKHSQQKVERGNTISKASSKLPQSRKGQYTNILNSSKSNKQIEQKNLEAYDPSRGGNLKVGIDLATLEEMRKGFGGLLYKFNYTVGYHGHHERGDFKGIKDGGYHFIGRDGLRRNVKYVANDFGYQPYLTQEQLKDSQVPKMETERNAGLQGYEFKWFIDRE